MKRIVLGLSIAAVAAFAAPPASAGVEIIRCGITPRIPCGVCYTDVTVGQICVPGEIEG